MTPQTPDKTRDDGERSGVKIKRRRTTILILAALLLGYPAYKAGVFATVGVDVKQVCPHGAVVGIRAGDGIQTGDED